MKRSTITWIVSIALVTVGAGLTIYLLEKSAAAASAAEDERLAQIQLKLARAEGIPTTAEEFKATIPVAKPEENAAPFYRQLKKPLHIDTRLKSRLTALLKTLPYGGSAEANQSAKELLVKFEPALALVDQAATKPRCWFDRDWSLGGAVYFPELDDIKVAAQALAVRGSVEANSGKPLDAIADAHKLFKMGKHLYEEPNAIPRFVGDRIYGHALKALANWSFSHREVPQYRQALKDAIDQMPRPNLKAEHSSDLYCVLNLIDQCSTPEKMKKWGLSEEAQSVSAAANIVSKVAPKHAKARIIEASRKIWAAIDSAPEDMQDTVDAASMDILQAMLAFPVAAKLYDPLGLGADYVGQRIPKFEALRQQFVAAYRALKGPSIAKQIQTSDLLSPFDGKPLAYHFDGRQIVITVSGYEDRGQPLLMKFPSDDVLNGKR